MPISKKEKRVSMRTMHVGKYNLSIVSDGYFHLDAGTMFCHIPKTIWSKTVKVDAENRMKLALNCLLIQYNDKNILVNAGMGEKLSEKLKKIYKLEQQENIVSSLQEIGVNPEDVDFVVLSHLHLDHCGGATRWIEGKSQPAFPNARYIIQREEWESAINPNELTRGSYLPENILPLENQLMLIDSSLDLTDIGFPGVKIVKTRGHSDGHQIVEIDNNTQKVVYTSDLVPTSKHTHIPCTMAWDIDPITVINKKKELLTKYKEENYIVIWEHDTEYYYGKIGFKNGRYFAKDLVPRLA